jgi:hypothetical protein
MPAVCGFGDRPDSISGLDGGPAADRRKTGSSARASITTQRSAHVVMRGQGARDGVARVLKIDQSANGLVGLRGLSEVVERAVPVVVKQRVSEGLSLNQALPLLRGVERSLGDWPPTAGSGCSATWSGTRPTSGLKPGSDYHTVTKADGTAVLEIDGRPAVDFVAGIIGPDTSWEDYPLFVTLGLNKGERYGAFREEDYANKLVMAVDKERGALIMFEADLQAGTDVQLMRRSIDLDYGGRRCEELLDRLGDRRPFLALYLDCCGRACRSSSRARRSGCCSRAGPRRPSRSTRPSTRVTSTPSGRSPG